jgi:hypothetical protein
MIHSSIYKSVAGIKRKHWQMVREREWGGCDSKRNTSMGSLLFVKWWKIVYCWEMINLLAIEEPGLQEAPHKQEAFQFSGAIGMFNCLNWTRPFILFKEDERGPRKKKRSKQKLTWKLHSDCLMIKKRWPQNKEQSDRHSFRFIEISGVSN